jgi:hypothetical protein
VVEGETKRKQDKVGATVAMWHSRSLNRQRPRLGVECWLGRDSVTAARNNARAYQAPTKSYRQATLLTATKEKWPNDVACLTTRVATNNSPFQHSPIPAHLVCTTGQRKTCHHRRSGGTALRYMHALLAMGWMA